MRWVCWNAQGSMPTVGSQSLRWERKSQGGDTVWRVVGAEAQERRGPQGGRWPEWRERNVDLRPSRMPCSHSLCWGGEWARSAGHPGPVLGAEAAGALLPTELDVPWRGSCQKQSFFLKEVMPLLKWDSFDDSSFLFFQMLQSSRADNPFLVLTSSQSVEDHEDTL